MIKNVEAKVRVCLENYPITRDDDYILTGAIYTRWYGVKHTDSYLDILSRKDLPRFETISRARRKLQERDESLRGTKRKEKIRMDAQKEFIEYALSDK